MKGKIFASIARLSIRKPWIVAIVTLVLLLISVTLSENLVLKTNFKDLMPQSHPIVTEYNNIVENYQGASMEVIGAIGEEESLINFVNEVAPEIQKHSSLVKRVEYKLNKEFFENHGFMIMKQKDLKNNLNSFSDLGLVPYLTEINNSFETTYIADGEESLSNKEKENAAISQLDGLKVWIESMTSYVEDPSVQSAEASAKVVDKMLFGDEYFLSQDRKMIMFLVQPSFSLDDLEQTELLITTIDSIIGVKLANYPEITLAGPAGLMAMAVDEMRAVEKDMSLTTILAFILILVLFVLSFRMWSAPLLAFSSLIVGIVLTIGFVTLAIGSLNIMTSMFAVILIGLGIDFNIHVITTYNQLRVAKKPPDEAIKLTFQKTASGVLVGGLTTTLAFLTLMISENQGMKEFGLVAGAGVFLCVLSSLLVLPSLIVLQERLRFKRVSRIELRMSGLSQESAAYNKLKNKVLKKQTIKTTPFSFLGTIADSIAKYRVLVLSLVVAASAFLVYNATQLRFDYDFLNLEPEGMRSIVIQDSVISKFDLATDMVLVTTKSVEESRALAEKAKQFHKVGMVSSISDYIPSPADYEQKLEYIHEIRNQLKSDKASLPGIGDIEIIVDELYRLEDNFIELAQMAFAGGQDRIDSKINEITGDLELEAIERQSKIGLLVALLQRKPDHSIAALNVFQEHYEPALRSALISMCSMEPITVENLSEEIKTQFISSDGNQFLVTIFPKEQVWDGEFLELFSKEMHKIDEHVTGFPLIIYVLIDYIEKDGRLAMMVALIVIFLLLLFDFRNVKLALVTLVPLVFGVIWMVGFMHLFGMKMNILNAIGLPLILGMGVDTGVHVIHRYRVEGPGNLRTVFSTTGKAVLISSLTSFLAFGSLGFAAYRGLASLGITLAIGIATCWLATVTILPAILSIMDNKKMQ